jgi:putative ABC transport system ATP-binding protein
MGISSEVTAEALRLLNHLGMDEPNFLEKPVTELSVGQQQRVAAARALIGTPELLIADEPTSSLDADRREDFIRLLFSECDRNKTTVLFVSHDTSLEKMFDRTIRFGDINSV